MITKEFSNIIDPNKEFYTYDKLLSHEADISWAISIRDIGKSYDARKRLDKAIRNGYSCIWLRWQRKEIGTAIDSWLEQFPDYEDLTPKGQNIIYRKLSPNYGVTFIVFAPVKDSNDVKDIQIPNLKWIMYDECVPEQYDIKTRRDVEFDKFTSIYMSFARKSKGVRAIMACNVIDWFNPFTQGFKIVPFDSGKIKVFLYPMKIQDEQGKTIETTLKIAVENVKPSRKMLQRVIELAKLRYTDEKELQRYINSGGGKEYTMIGVCPNLSIPLEDLQFRRGERYYGFRVMDDIYYICEIKPRKDYPTEVFKFGSNGHMEGRRPQIGKIFEQLINENRVRFENGHVFNEFMAGLSEYRMRNTL